MCENINDAIGDYYESSDNGSLLFDYIDESESNNKFCIDDVEEDDVISKHIKNDSVEKYNKIIDKLDSQQVSKPFFNLTKCANVKEITQYDVLQTVLDTTKLITENICELQKNNDMLLKIAHINNNIVKILLK